MPVIKADKPGCRSTSVGFDDKLNPLDDDFYFTIGRVLVDFDNGETPLGSQQKRLRYLSALANELHVAEKDIKSSSAK